MNERSIEVYKAITKVTAALAKAGISKGRENKMQGYAFRGIDDVYNALSPFLADAQLCILPLVLERECIERTSAKGGALFYVTVKVQFSLVSAIDGSDHSVCTYGEAMDSGDKATNKAMSAAYKYMAMEVFCIPTEGDNDADATTHEVKPRPNTATQVAVDAFEAMPEDEKRFLQEHAIVLIDMHEKRAGSLYEYIEKQRLESEESLALWSLLPSNVRTAYKAEKKAYMASAAGLASQA